VPTRRLRPAPAVCIALVLVVLLGVGCGGASDGSAGGGGTETAVAAGPVALQPAAPAASPGTTRVTCDLATGAGPLRFALDLPEGFTGGARRHDAHDSVDCAWRRSVRVRGPSGPGHTAVVRVGVGYVRGDDDRPTLSDVHDDEEVNAVEGDDPQDDDSILHLTLVHDVPVFGATLGDRLSFWCFCDGQDTITRYAQADRVRVQWSSVRELEAETDAQLAAALAGAGTVT
jgi:hypothetical protein